MAELKLLIIGAHPDDCETAGGIALRFVHAGHAVKFLTVTNGCSGHQASMGGALSRVRAGEAEKVSKLFGVEYEMMDNNDAYLVAGIPERVALLRAIRLYAPDIIITHRPNDYHPDHRAASILVQDCSYLVQVPNICALTPVLRYQPAIFYMQDRFKKPYPFQPDLVFDISDIFEEKMRMYHQYASQVYEWLPWVDGVENVPGDEEERFNWLMDGGLGFIGRNVKTADWYREKLVAKYGERGKIATQAEALEICEYGGQLSAGQLMDYFPF